MSGLRHGLLATLAFALVASAGCASRYVPSERQRRLQAAMDPAEAANLFVDALGPTLKGAGLCKAPFGFDAPEATVTMDAFTVQAWRKGEELGRRQEGGRTVVSFRKERHTEERPFAALRRVTILRDAQVVCAVRVPFGQAAIALEGGGAGPIVVAVMPDALDDLLAAIGRLAPQAELMEGKGP